MALTANAQRTGAPVVGIFGMGLIGGAIGLGLRARGIASEVHAYDLDPKALETALALGAADRVHLAPGPWVRGLDVAFLCAPVRALPSLARSVSPHASPETLWLDVGSVKTPVLEEVAPLFKRFVGTHPMAGRETAGVESAYAGLLQSAVWVLCPAAGCPGADLAQAETLIEALGAYPLTMDAGRHDRAVARISHMPYLLAVGLNLLLAEDPDAETLLALAAGGFRDLTRVASGAPTMSRDMVTANADEVRDALGDLGKQLAALADIASDPEALLGKAEAAKRTRDALPIVRRSILPRVHDVMIDLEDRPRELARLTTVLGDADINIRDIEVLKIREGGEAIRVGVATESDREGALELLTAAGYRCR